MQAIASLVEIGPFTGIHEPNTLTCYQLSGLITQLVKHRTGIAEVLGSNLI